MKKRLFYIFLLLFGIFSLSISNVVARTHLTIDDVQGAIDSVNPNQKASDEEIREGIEAIKEENKNKGSKYADGKTEDGGSTQDGNSLAKLNDSQDVNFCNQDTVKAFIFIGKILNIIKILVPLIIIVLGMIAFFKSMLSDNENSNKEATMALIKRIIAGVIVFIVPTICFAILDILIPEDYKDYNNNFICSKCVVNPSVCDEEFIKNLPTK